MNGCDGDLLCEILVPPQFRKHDCKFHKSKLDIQFQRLVCGKEVYGLSSFFQFDL